MTIFVLLCLSLLDFQHLPKSVNPFAKFVVVDAVDPTAMTGCTMNPSQGRPADVMIEVDWFNPHEPEYTEPLAAWATSHTNSIADAPAPKVVPYKPPVLPDPEPEPPSVAVVPEPPTAAILTVSVVVLIYLLFGRIQKSHIDSNNTRQKT